MPTVISSAFRYFFIYLTEKNIHPHPFLFWNTMDFLLRSLPTLFQWLSKMCWKAS